MRNLSGTIQLSAGDLVGHLSCRYLTQLDAAVAAGNLKAPWFRDPFLEILAERGAAHERSYVEHLEKAGYDITRIGGSAVAGTQVDATIRAMRSGVHIIVQGVLSDGRWVGHPDILMRMGRPS